ncbi:hypothetical protein KAU08_06150 [bacterium]|nr:hypothetical protein [bacterium]
MKKYLVSLLLIAILLSFGCNSNGGDPASPVVPPNDETGFLTNEVLRESTGSNHMLLSFWEVVIDGETEEVAITPLRSAMFNCNIAHFMAPPVNPQTLITIKLLPGTDFLTGFLDLDIAMLMPFPGVTELKGFDTRLIILSDGSSMSEFDPDIFYATEANLEPVMINADGLTRWWNYPEFIDPLPLLSFKSFAISTLPDPSATINPYKYYADALTLDDPVSEIPPETRGVFSDKTVPHHRRHQIQFLLIDGYPVFKFNMAVDTSWALPDPAYAPEYPVESYPPEAQCQEAYNVVFNASVSDLWYLDGYGSGGSVTVTIEVFDWQSLDNPGGVEGEVAAIMLESPLMLSPTDFLSVATVSPGTQTTSAIFAATISAEDLAITGVGTFPVLGRVENVDPNTYVPQFEGGETFIYPDGPLAAYFNGIMVVVEGLPPLINVIQPDGGEVWSVGSSQEITWSGDPGITDVTILYSKDDFVSDINTISLSTPHDGSYTWDAVPNDPSLTVKVRIHDASDSAISDDSDEDFIILGSGFEVLIPNGGEVWMVGSAHDIEWTGGAGITSVTLLYSKDDFGSDVIEIEAGHPNSGVYAWTIPDDVSETVRVRVQDAGDPGFYDDSDDYFTISDACDFSLAPEYLSYVEHGAVMGSGFHLMQADTGKIVACLPEDGLETSYPWIAVYDETDLFNPLDTFQIPGWAYPYRPFCHEVVLTDRIFFVMAEDGYASGWQGPTYDEIFYIDWVGSEIVDSSLASIDISSFLDSGELGAQICVDVSDDVYALTNQGKVIKFDHTNGYSGSILFDLDGATGYPSALEIDFLKAQDDDVFFIYTEYGDKNRAIYKVSSSGVILASETNIWSGVVTGCGSGTGGIGEDGYCRLVIIDGSSMYEWGCIRYDYDFNTKASTVLDQYYIYNHPGNTMQFTDDGALLFNTYFWQWKNFLVTYTLPADW